MFVAARTSAKEEEKGNDRKEDNSIAVVKKKATLKTTPEIMALMKILAEIEKLPPLTTTCHYGNTLLQRQGWLPGTGLGPDKKGRVDPVMLVTAESLRGKNAGIGV